MSDRSRRDFLKEMALGVGTLALGACGGRGARAAAAAASGMAPVRPSLDNAGIQLFTVRDRLGDQFERTLAGLAEIGYRQVEPFTYGSYTPEQIRGMLDRTGLKAPSTHVQVRPGPDLERTLAGFQAIGHRYAQVGAPAGPPRPPGSPPPARPAEGGGPPRQAAPTLDSTRRLIEAYHEVGRAGKAYGVTPLVHNHTWEFQRLADGDGRTQFDLFLAELDPSLVALELDIGWATVAGQDAVAMFRAHPGRFPLWHVKDMADLAAVRAAGDDQFARMRAAKIVPLGGGEIDYRPVFAASATAGLQHYFVEQDSAPQSGDSLAAARTSFEALRRTLS